MKILELRFRNLNSLYGEWVIDFTHPEFISNGIFALTGPTGAGKSTILDAVCLALYGATPRLGRITKSTNEVMSRQTGSCYAEVLFESQKGRFRCRWEQRRARNRPEGNLQDQEHQISEGDTGRIIEAKKSIVSAIIEEKTGMDFDRFTRSILLAQGGFDTFLKADAEQKSRILEQITGTEIYTEISKKVHEHQRDQREKLRLLQAEASGIAVLKPEEVQQAQQELQTLKLREKELRKAYDTTQEAITWLSGIGSLQQELTDLSQEAVLLNEKIEAFKPEQDKLNRADQAASVEGVFAAFSALRKQQAADQSALEHEAQRLPDLEAAVEKQSALHHAAEEQKTRAKQTMQEAAPVIQSARSLDQHLKGLTASRTDMQKRCDHDAAAIEELITALKTEQERKKDAQTTLKEHEDYLKEHSQDAWLISGLEHIQDQLDSLSTLKQHIAGKADEMKEAESALSKALKNQEKIQKKSLLRRQETQDIAKNIELDQEAMKDLLGDRMLREYRAEKDTLLRELAYLKRIEQLETYRSKLEAGKPCPLCGSMEHPFAEGTPPAADATEERLKQLSELISGAEVLEESAKELEKALADAQKKLSESERHELTAAAEVKDSTQTLTSERTKLESMESNIAGLNEIIMKKLLPLGVTEIPEDVTSLQSSLTTRLDAWNTVVNNKEAATLQITSIDKEITRLEAVIETHRAAREEHTRQLEHCTEAFEKGKKERITLFGEKDPDKEESRIQKALDKAEHHEEKARNLLSELQRTLQAAATSIEDLKKRITLRMSELEEAESAFSAALHTAGFHDEQQFLHALLTGDQRKELYAQAKKLEHDLIELKTRTADREKHLARERAKEITDASLDELKPRYDAYEASLHHITDEISGLTYRLQEHTAALVRVKKKQEAIEAQQMECRRWETLHSLIGSSDGKKYRSFAQGLTFELMVTHANRQLQQMTDRYLLIRDDKDPLELNVIDSYQAGEIRSTKNLSGGESFIVSLTLALGLSKMASRKVRVDSLFLDEGFGTLDEDALETALETLSGLQQEGKLIGIISHVSAMKERISTQITITPATGGRSLLSGPGCSHIGV